MYIYCRQISYYKVNSITEVASNRLRNYLFFILLRIQILKMFKIKDAVGNDIKTVSQIPMSRFSENRYTGTCVLDRYEAEFN